MCEVRKTVHAVARHRLQQVAHDLGGHRVDGLERFVQEQHLGIGQERHGERCFLAHAVGAGSREGAAPVLQAQRVQQLRGARARLVAGHAVDVAGEQQVLFHGEIVEQAEILRQHADAALQLQRIGRGVQAAHSDLARGRRQQAGHHLHGGGFTRPIWPQERADRSGGHFQVDPLTAVNSPKRRVRLRQEIISSIVTPAAAKRDAGIVGWE